MEEKTAEDQLQNHLNNLAEVEVPERVTLEEVISLSEKFPVRFPTQTARLQTLLKGGCHDKATLEEQVNSAYPLVHERVLPLLAAFLHHKKNHGRKKERELYSTLGLLDLVDRFLKKRPIVFYNRNDIYLLRDGSEGCDGFMNIGHSQEHPNLSLKEYLSYDEMKLSALVCVSSRSCFINDGSRHNRGLPGAPGSFQPEGIIVGMVGTRLEREGVMEWQDCVVTPKQNSKERGYGTDPPPRRRLVREWARLWGKESLPTWDQASGTPEGEFFSCSTGMLFNTQVYKARIHLSAETLLMEASTRAAKAGMKAYIHVVGLGLGVWQLSPIQNQLFVDAWAAALAIVDTTHIGHVDFSWISEVFQCGDVRDGEKFPGTDVTVHFSQRSLHAPVPSGTLLVTSFAWDSNSFPGNEYWKGHLSSSGDPAAACSSGVAELHNALINPCVTATNLHVASAGRVEHVADYARRKLRLSAAPQGDK